MREFEKIHAKRAQISFTAAAGARFSEIASLSVNLLLSGMNFKKSSIKSVQDKQPRNTHNSRGLKGERRMSSPFRNL